LEQRSKQWHDWRKNKIGGSEIATVIGVNPYQKVSELWLIKTGQMETSDLSDNYFVKRGIELEPKARELINDSLSAEFTEATFNHDTIDHIGCSVDGYDFDRHEIIEIKTMGEKNHNKVYETKQPLDYYYPQCQWNMLVSKTPVCWFVSYCPQSTHPLIYFEVKENEAYQKMLVERSQMFWKSVLEYRLSKETLKELIELNEVY
jgi:putative phage-type endonuclease